VTERFSKIGSKPTLKEENINEILGSVITYFRQRLMSRWLLAAKPRQSRSTPPSNCAAFSTNSSALRETR
jgi:hypothetical protein